MKLRALVIISALALPAVALADDNAPKSPPSPSSDKTPDTNDKTTGTNDKTNEKTTNRSADTTTKTPSSPSNDKSASAKLSADDVKIISHLHHVNQMEIDLGKVAQKSGTAGFKSYGESLVTDHQSSDKDLTAFTKAHKLAAIPADKPQTDADRQDEKEMTTKVAHLKTLKGADFDKEFLTMMATGHDKELAKIDTSIGAATDPDLQSLLRSVKPVLQRHADQARDLQKNSPQASANEPMKLPSASH
jgi:putative membrane protein